ncbi:MAG: ProQ/FinO family protein [Cohaesibacter sp.]|nr:ProQ/FinO family protein [Cohaesibacter sp.]
MSKDQKQTLTAFADALLKAVHSKEEPPSSSNILIAKEPSQPPAGQRTVRPSKTLEPEVDKSTAKKDRAHLYRLPDRRKAWFLENLALALGLDAGDSSQLPKIFLSDQILPMKLGIHLDLFAHFGIQDDEQGKKIRSVLYQGLCRQLSYQRTIRDGTHRHDLDGNTVEEISDEYKKDADNQVKRIHQMIKKANREKGDKD